MATNQQSGTGMGTPFETTEANRVYTKGPDAMAALRLRFQDRVEGGELRGLTFGVPEIDAVVNTLWPGRLITILARPSNWKTSIMVHLARREAQRIMREGTGAREYVLFATLEEDEENIHQSMTGDAPIYRMLRGDYDPAAHRKASMYSVEWPVYMFGYQPTDRAEAVLGDDLPQLTVQQLYREIVQTERDLGIRPSVIFVDYAQIIDAEGDTWGDKRHNVIGSVVKTLRKIGKHVGCPVVLSVQAKEDVDDRKVPVPQGNDAYYSSEVFHASDVMLSLWYPCRYEASKHDGWITWQGKDYPVTPELLWVQLLKQRNGFGRQHWMVACDPAAQSIAPVETLTVGGAQKAALAGQPTMVPSATNGRNKPAAPPVTNYAAAALPVDVESEDFPW